MYVSRRRPKAGPVPPCAAPGCKDPAGGRCNPPGGGPKRINGRPYGVDGALCDTCYQRLRKRKRTAARRAGAAPEAAVPAVPEGGRRCTGCGRTKPVDAFNRNRSAYDGSGRDHQCRTCRHGWGAWYRDTDDYRGWRRDYKARRKADDPAAARDAARKAADRLTRYRATALGRLANGRAAARCRLGKAGPGTDRHARLAALVANYEAEMTRLGWEPRPRRRAAS